MKIPKIDVNLVPSNSGGSILETTLDHLAVLTSYDDNYDQYVSTVHMEPYGVVMTYTFDASDPDNEGLYMTHQFVVGVTLGAAVATGVL